MLFRRKSKDSLMSKESLVSIKKSRSARDLLLKLTTTPSQSKKSLEKNELENSRPKLSLDLNRQYLLCEEPFTLLTPRDDEFQDRDLMTPIRHMTETPETFQAPQQRCLRTHSEQRAKVLSTIIDFENESIVEMYTPRKPVHIQNSIRLDSACGILERISIGYDRDAPEVDQQASSEEGIYTNNHSVETDEDDLTFDGVFSTSTSCQNSPSKDPFDSVSLTETDIQIYKRTHRKSKHSSLHFVQGVIDSPTKPRRTQIAPLSTTTPLQAGLVEDSYDTKDAGLYQLEIMLLQEKHKYEMKQQQRAMKHLQLQLNQQRTENTQLRNRLAQLEYNGSLLPAFKWDKPATRNKDVKSPKVTFKDDDDAGSLVSAEESIMSLYYDERKVSGASTVGSSTNSVNQKV